MKTKREKLLRMVSVLGHIRVLKSTGARTVINPYKRKKSSKLRDVVRKVRA